MDKKCGLLVLCSVILLACLVGPVSGKTWYVDDDGGTEFTRIQDAVDNATAGDTIIVKDGTYVENVDVIVANVTLKSENGSVSTIVQAADSSNHVFNVTASYVTLSGFTVEDAKIPCAGIYLYQARNCNISTSNLSNCELSIALSRSCNNTISGNSICNNSEIGIYLSYSSINTITGNTLSSNAGMNIYDESCNNSITGNTLSCYVIGIDIWNSCNNSISDNGLESDILSIQLYNSSNNIIDSNNVWNGITLLDRSSNNIITENIVNGGVYLWYVGNNVIYLNNFINSTKNAYSHNSTSIWNSPEEITYTYNGSTCTNYLGNYWGDYEGKYPDAEEIAATGIWNTPYDIDGDSDTYPLMEPFENYIT
jgi:nitrous oxidase accessory protein